MSGPGIRLILKVPAFEQYGMGEYVNVTSFKTFDVHCPPDLYEHLSRSGDRSVVVGAEPLFERQVDEDDIPFGEEP